MIRTAFVVLLLLGLAGCSEDEADAPTQPDEHGIAGTLVIEEVYDGAIVNMMEGKGCSDKPYDAGTNVVVENEDGTVISTGQLREATWEPGAKIPRASGVSYEQEVRCALPFALPDIPRSEFYTVSVGSSSVTYSYAELAAQQYRVELVVDKRPDRLGT